MIGCTPRSPPRDRPSGGILLHRGDCVFTLRIVCPCPRVPRRVPSRPTDRALTWRLGRTNECMHDAFEGSYIDARASRGNSVRNHRFVRSVDARSRRARVPRVHSFIHSFIHSFPFKGWWIEKDDGGRGDGNDDDGNDDATTATTRERGDGETTGFVLRVVV